MTPPAAPTGAPAMPASRSAHPTVGDAPLRHVQWRAGAQPVRSVVLAIAVAALAGCAGTEVQRAEQLGALGKAYADTVSAAGNAATSSSIAFALDEIVKERKAGALGDEQAREDALTRQIQTLMQRQQLVAESNQQLALLAAYFAALESFANEAIGKEAEAATTGLADSIVRVGKAIEANPQAKARVSAAEATAIARLAGLVAHQIHGRALARTLERDAAMIGTQLRLVAKVLATYSEWIRTRTDLELADHYRHKVIRPFVAAGALPAAWDRDVRHYLEGATYAPQLGKALDAAKRMEVFWAGYLAGDTSVVGLVADLKEVRVILEAILAYQAARAKND
jgi:hypothetical protein